MEVQLPPVFAVFDARPSTGRNDFSYNNRFWVCRSYEHEDRVGIGYFRERLRFSVKRCPEPMPKVLLHTSHVYWWLTGYEIIPTGSWHTHTVPVLDFYDTEFIHGPFEFRQTADNDELGIFLERMFDQRHLFREMAARVPRPPSPTAPPPILTPAPSKPAGKPPSKLPNYVASLLVSDAKKKGDSCPISMTPFTDCPQIAVTDCYHCFDAPALWRWLSSNTTCPLCKQTQPTAPQLVS